MSPLELVTPATIERDRAENRERIEKMAAAILNGIGAPFAKPPVVPRPFREVTDTSVMALSAVHDTKEVLDQARGRVNPPKRKKPRRRRR